MKEQQKLAEIKRAKRRFRNLGRKIPEGMLRFAGLKRVGLVDDADYGPSIHLGVRPWQTK